MPALLAQSDPGEGLQPSQGLTGGTRDGTKGEGTVTAAGVTSAAARGKTLAADTASEAARPPGDTHKSSTAGCCTGCGAAQNAPLGISAS